MWHFFLFWFGILNYFFRSELLAVGQMLYRLFDVCGSRLYDELYHIAGLGTNLKVKTCHLLYLKTYRNFLTNLSEENRIII